MRRFNLIMSISDRKYCQTPRSSQTLSIRDGVKSFRRNATCLCLTILLNEFILRFILLMMQCKQKLFEFGSNVRKYVLGADLMHYKVQVPPNRFGISAGELVKDFEYIWKSRVVSLLHQALTYVDPSLRQIPTPRDC
jgi:hypothetical protein